MTQERWRKGGSRTRSFNKLERVSLKHNKEFGVFPTRQVGGDFTEQDNNYLC